MKRVLIIHTGGTFGMTPVTPEKTLRPGKIEKSIEQYVPKAYQLAEIDIQIPFNMDSSDIGPPEWIILYRILKTKMDRYDGFVLIHGTDTLVYTASALSYLFLNLAKPIILTGSQRPLSALRNDARNNLINAVELATLPIPEVMICFNDKLLRGNRTKKTSIESFDSFSSPNYPELARIGLNVQVNNRVILERIQQDDLNANFSDQVTSIRVFPGLNPSPYFTWIETSCRAVILEGFGAGNLPLNAAWINFIEQMVNKQIQVYICSQSPHGSVDLELYASGRLAKEAGAESLKDMTIEASLVKLMILLANIRDGEKLKSQIALPLAGEMTI